MVCKCSGKYIDIYFILKITFYSYRYFYSDLGTDLFINPYRYFYSVLGPALFSYSLRHFYSALDTDNLNL